MQNPKWFAYKIVEAFANLSGTQLEETYEEWGVSTRNYGSVDITDYSEIEDRITELRKAIKDAGVTVDEAYDSMICDFDEIGSYTPIQQGTNRSVQTVVYNKRMGFINEKM